METFIPATPQGGYVGLEYLQEKAAERQPALGQEQPRDDQGQFRNQCELPVIYNDVPATDN